jgi:glycosyltransferase involved in cell wall biosynthesis
MIPTVQLSIVLPLQKQIDNGQCVIEFLTEHQLKLKFGKQLRSEAALKWITQRWDAFNPQFIVFCRYSGPHAASLLNLAQARNTPTIYCVDDDLLNVPKELGEKKFAYHNHPLRLEAVRTLLREVSVVYCSNQRLASRLKDNPMKGQLVAASIFCAVDVLVKPQLRPVRRLGYMGFDHAYDFELAIPAIVKLLTQYPDLVFELFGKIPKPPELEQFGDRVIEIPPVDSYEDFLVALAARAWDIGIAPLAATPFNAVKNINKWIEYSATGAAVVASKSRIYDDCCANECGLLSEDDGWFEALDTIIKSPQLRVDLATNAQRRLSNEFNLELLTDQLMNSLKTAASSTLQKV